MKTHLSYLHAQTMQPSPFVYTHLLYLLTWLYLPLSAATLGLNADSTSVGINDPLAFVMGLATVFVNCTFQLCLLNVGSQLGEPFGSDLLDFQVFRYLKETMWMSATILKGAASSSQCRHDVDQKGGPAWMQLSYEDVFGTGGLWPDTQSLKESKTALSSADGQLKDDQNASVTVALDSGRRGPADGIRGLFG